MKHNLKTITLIAALAITSQIANASAWQYQEQQDEMGRGTAKYALTESPNTVTFWTM
jgi:hypothetical protein